MESYGADTAARQAAFSAGLVDSIEALCVGYDWPNSMVVVNISGAELAMPWTGEPPWVGDRVRVTTVGGRRHCQAVWGSGLGTVTVVGGNHATVTGDDGRTYRYPYRFGETLSAGNRVALSHATRFVLGRLSTNPDPEPEPGPIPPPPPSGSTRQALFNPIDSGNFMNGAYRDQMVEISTTRSAAYWYGAQIRDTIPDTATVTKAELRLVEKWDRVPATATVLRLHGDQGRGGEPGLLGPSIGITGGGAIDIRPFADALKTGGAFGVAFTRNTGWRQFGSLFESGGIYMEWRL